MKIKDKKILTQSSRTTNFIIQLINLLGIEKHIAKKIVNDPQVKEKIKKVRSATEQFLESAQKIKHLNY